MPSKMAVGRSNRKHTLSSCEAGMKPIILPTLWGRFFLRLESEMRTLRSSDCFSQLCSRRHKRTLRSSDCFSQLCSRRHKSCHKMKRSPGRSKWQASRKACRKNKNCSGVIEGQTQPRLVAANPNPIFPKIEDACALGQMLNEIVTRENRDCTWRCIAEGRD